MMAITGSLRTSNSQLYNLHLYNIKLDYLFTKTIVHIHHIHTYIYNIICTYVYTSSYLLSVAKGVLLVFSVHNHEE